MAAQSADPTLEDSWVVSELEESVHSQVVIIGENETAQGASNNLTPISSYSEGDLIRDYEEAEPIPTACTSNIRDPTESVVTIASSVSSGPELIMPSIVFENRASEHGSWVIPRKRSKQSLYESRKAPKLPKQRSETTSQQQEAPHSKKAKKIPTVAPTRPNTGVRWFYFTQIRDCLSSDLHRYQFVRFVLNSLLILVTIHLLVFPELIHQAPSICKVSTVSKIYSQTCAGINRNISGIPGIPTNFQSTIHTQNQLQSYLNQTVQDMTPIDAFLKDSDTILREIYIDIRKEYGNARHEIELEFEGAWAASRAITRALMSLKVDMKTTVDGLQIPIHRFEYIKGAARTSRQNVGNLLSQWMPNRQPDASKQEENSIVALDQFTQLNQELDSTIARLSHRTDTLLVQLAKLDDHLQSIKELSVREQERLNPTKALDGIQMDNVWTSLTGLIQAAKTVDATTIDDKENKVLSELERIASYHDLMADVVGKLDKELKALQKIRAIRT